MKIYQIGNVSREHSPDIHFQSNIIRMYRLDQTGLNGPFRYATKESALETCAKHEDCGGVTKINAGRFECRAKTFKPDSSSISWRKPDNMKHQKYTKDDVNPRKSS